MAPLSLADLALDGIIDVVMRIVEDSNNQVGLYFVSSLLVAQVSSAQPAEVPEPGTLVVGLAALGYRSQRRRGVAAHV